MTCQEVNELLMDYVSGELPPDVHQALERHLAICPDCVTYLDSYRKTVEATRAVFDDSVEIDPPPPPAELEAILTAVAHTLQKRRSESAAPID